LRPDARVLPEVAGLNAFLAVLKRALIQHYLWLSSSEKATNGV
jgi:hypothetical protein